MKYCDISNIVIEKSKKEIVYNMVTKKHYANTWTASSDIYAIYYKSGKHKFFDGEELKLIGCVIYGNPVGFRVVKSISEELTDSDVLELKRLWIEDGYGSNIESWFISQSFKWLKENTDIKALISYADPKEGHAGTIYQATNWIYQGNSIRPNDTYSFKLKPDDEWIHGRTLANTYKTNDIEKLKKKIGHTFWYRVEPLKHRYVYLLKNKRKLMKHLKHPIKPYPKADEVDKLKVFKVEPS